MSVITGTYKMESAENLQQFYDSAGMPWITSKIMLLSKPTMTVNMEKDENEDNVEEIWVIKTVTFLITKEHSFKFGEPHEETMPNGDVCECVAEKVGDNRIVLKNTGEDNIEFVRELEFTKDGLVEVMKMNGVEAKRTFKREK